MPLPAATSVEAYVRRADGRLITHLPADGVDADLEAVHPADAAPADVGTGRRSPHDANAVFLVDGLALDQLPTQYAAESGAPGLAAPGPTAPGGLPAAVDLRAEMPAVRFQGARPVCEIMAVCAALDHLYAGDPSRPVRTHSPQFLWWNYQRTVASRVQPREVWGNTGTDGPHLAFALRRAGHAAGEPYVPPEQGTIDEALAPFDPDLAFDAPGDDPLAVAKRHLGATADRIARGEALPAQGAEAMFLRLDLATLKAALADRRPVVIGLPVREDDWESLTAWQDLLPDLTPGSAADTAGHAVLLVGYADDPAVPGGGAFLFRNSWGTSWANAGYGRVSYQMTLDYADDPYVLAAEPAPYAGRFQIGFPQRP